MLRCVEQEGMWVCSSSRNPCYYANCPRTFSLHSAVKSLSYLSSWHLNKMDNTNGQILFMAVVIFIAYLDLIMEEEVMTASSLICVLYISITHINIQLHLS